MKKIILAGIILFVISIVSLHVYFSPTISFSRSYSGIPSEKLTPSTLFYRDPVDKAASPSTQNVLSLLYKRSIDQKIGFYIGQNIGHASNTGPNENGNPYIGVEKYVNTLEKITGRRPVIMGAGYGPEDHEPDADTILRMNPILINHWKQGGFVEVSFSPHNPWTNGGVKSFGTGDYTYDDIFTPGNDAYNRWNAELDRIATGLVNLEDNGVVVMWRPFQEMNADWFWWSYGENGRATQEEFSRLWRYTFTYLTEKKGLHNLLFVYAPNSASSNERIKPATYYYPGDDVVDVLGLDYYADNTLNLNAKGDYDALVQLGKPVGLAEIGPSDKKPIDNLLVLKSITEKYPNIVFAMYWNSRSWVYGLFPTERAIIDNHHASEFMNSDAVITLDEL